uniref:Sodium leak channel non-selective protein n=1 Tax=Strongyloides papillosus TaxID=174720 RepID=A0A0N5BLE3_STREA
MGKTSTTRLLMAKAAVISGAMIASKTSESGISNPSEMVKKISTNENYITNKTSKDIQGPQHHTSFRPKESLTTFADLLNASSALTKKRLRTEFLEKKSFINLLKLACVFDLFTVSLNTPKTLELWSPLLYIIFVVDTFTTITFLVENIIKIKYYGFIKRTNSYFRQRWLQFDFILMLSQISSWILEVYLLITIHMPFLNLTYRPIWTMIRCVRPLVIIRLIRLTVNFNLPQNRIQQLLRRSSQQVQNVTVFFVFFMALYAILGIQLFGRLDYHCVLPGTDPSNVTIHDLAIPDTMCSKKGGGGYECPDNLECMKLDLNAKAEGFYGMFDNFGASVFTVYMAASEEGWVYVLYDCMDSLPSHLAFIYFLTLIFFLAWLVKNVFIAVITETFAEIRVQFSEMWQKNDVSIEEEFKSKIEKGVNGWNLVKLDLDNKIVTGKYQILSTILHSVFFQAFVITFVLTNAFVNASFFWAHNESDIKRKELYYKIECVFTIIFDIECFVKIMCFGFKQYWKRNVFKFELILAIGSTLNILPIFYDKNIFTYFQVFRLLRLIKASPILEEFVWKIFSPGKKLGGLVIFTVTFIIIASTVSLQLFLHVPDLHHFQTFPQAFMAMFQIITQEGWTDFVVEVLRMINDEWTPFVAIYFVAYHLFVTLIVLSLFVAVILDNLEMDEELKKMKQLKAKEQTTSMRLTLPWRLRIFEKFPTRPQMVKLKKITSDFPTPKMRDSFTHQFVINGEADTEDHFEDSAANSHKKLLTSNNKIFSKMKTISLRHSGFSTMGNMIKKLFTKNRHHQANYFNNKNLDATQKIIEQLNENGDFGRFNEYPNEELKKDSKSGGGIDIKAFQQKRLLAEFTRSRIEEEMRENHPYFDSPLFLFGRDSKFRKFCEYVVNAQYNYLNHITDNNVMSKYSRNYKQIRSIIGLLPYLDWFMVFVTSISCISMIFESPWPTTGENLVMFNFYLQICDYIFVLAMTIELTMKIVANGLFFTPKAFCKDLGAFMTLFIYITSLIFLLTMKKKVEINSKEQLLMICRAMRPLRIYTLVPHIRRVVVELFRGFKEILLVTILMIVVMFMFASFGVQTVGGRLAACNDPTITTRENCTGVFWQKIFVTRLEVHGKNDEDIHPKILVPRVWTNPRNFNFDHIGNSMLALFETLSYKGWNVIRDILMKRQGPWAVVFIHIYVFIGCMIGLTLFVGVIIANYTQNRGTALLTVDQRRWHDLKARLKMAQPLHVPPKPRDSAKFRKRVYDWTMSKTFNNFFFYMVIFNSATLLVPWSVEEEKELSKFLYFVTFLSAIANVAFAIEVILKIIAYTINGFWQSRRNKIDLLITAFGIIWIFLHFFVALPASVVGGAVSLKRYTYTFGYVVVVARFFTIAGRNTILKMLMLTVVMSMYRSFFIILAMFLLVLFYAYTGVILFGMVKYGQAVSKHVNFRSGSEALVVLFRSVTGEDWNDIFHDSSISPPFCYWKEGLNYWETDCGNYYGAIIYFCSFYLIITYIVRNLLVAVIMENFSLFYSSEEDALLSYADIKNFQLIWNMLDTEQKGSIPVRRVKFLLRLLKGRLEVDVNKDRLLFKHMCYEMEKIHNGDDVTFHDVLYMLSYRSVDIRKSLELEELLQREELEYIIEEEVAKQTIKMWLEKCLRKNRNLTVHKETVIHPTSFYHSMVHSTDDDEEYPKFIPLGNKQVSGVLNRSEISSSDKLTSIYSKTSVKADLYHSRSTDVIQPDNISTDIPTPKLTKHIGKVKERRKSISDVNETKKFINDAAKKFLNSSNVRKISMIGKKLSSSSTTSSSPHDQQQNIPLTSVRLSKHLHHQLSAHNLDQIEEWETDDGDIHNSTHFITQKLSLPSSKTTIDCSNFTLSHLNAINTHSRSYTIRRARTISPTYHNYTLREEDTVSTDIEISSINEDIEKWWDSIK